MIKLKRAYEKPDPTDGYRILIDRLWPRGISKAKAKIDLWLKDIAPSKELRQWFKHDPDKWPKFQECYRRELKDNPEAAASLKQMIKKYKDVTLVYSAKDEQRNDAVVLKNFLNKK